MLTGKQKRYLRSEAHALKPIFQVGKEGVTRNMIDGIKDALEAHELMKVKILESCTSTKNEVALEISMATRCEVVQMIGNTIVLYKKSKKEIYKL